MWVYWYTILGTFDKSEKKNKQHETPQPLQAFRPPQVGALLFMVAEGSCCVVYNTIWLRNAPRALVP